MCFLNDASASVFYPGINAETTIYT